MRTTIDLPDDLHRRASTIAHDTSRTLSETIADLVRRGLSQAGPEGVSRSDITGLAVVRLGAVATLDDVRSLEDDER